MRSSLFRKTQRFSAPRRASAAIAEAEELEEGGWESLGGDQCGSNILGTTTFPVCTIVPHLICSGYTPLVSHLDAFDDLLVLLWLLFVTVGCYLFIYWSWLFCSLLHGWFVLRLQLVHLGCGWFVYGYVCTVGLVGCYRLFYGPTRFAFGLLTLFDLF